MDSDSYYVMILDSCGKVVWKYGCDMVMCAKNEEDIAKLSGTLRIYRTGRRAYDSEWDWRVFGDISKKDDDYYRYAHVGAMTGTGESPQEEEMEENTRYCVEARRISDGRQLWEKVVDGPLPTCIKFVGEADRCTREDCLNEAVEASPCDTGECDCYMGPIYSVSVGDIEFEETRSPDPAEAWRMFLPILERNPGFADRGARLEEVGE